MSRLAVVLLALVASGCGSAEMTQQPAEQLEPAPPIEAIDEPAPDSLFFDESEGTRATGVHFICFADEPSTERTTCELTAEQKAEAEKRAREFREATKPAEGGQPRAVARLALSSWRPPATAALVAWRARAGKLCMLIDLRDESGGGGSGPLGPCVPAEEGCTEICLQRSGTGDGAELTEVLAGTVPTRGDQIRVAFVHEAAATYPLVGPTVPGFPEARVFMLDLGNRIYRTIEVFREGKVLGKVEVSQEEIDWEECIRRFPTPMPENPAAEPADDPNPELSACLRKAYRETDDG